MFFRIFFRIAAVLLLIAGLCGVGALAFNAGMARGAMLAQAASQAAGQSAQGAAPLAYPPFYAYAWHPGFHPGFGLAFLGLLLFGFLFFGLIGRLVFFGRMQRAWGAPGHWMHGGPMWAERGKGPEHIPPFMVEMHRRLHEEEARKSAAPAHQEDPGAPAA